MEMQRLGQFTGRILECEVCHCPAMFVNGEPKATDPGDQVKHTVTEVRATDVPTVTFHRAICPRR